MIIGAAVGSVVGVAVLGGSAYITSGGEQPLQWWVQELGE